MDNGQITRNDTKNVKGVVIIFMLLHHMRINSERFPLNFNFNDEWIHIMEEPLSQALARFGDICVASFLFLAGYGLYYKIKKENDDLPIGKMEPFASIKHLYINFWKVFLIFIPLGYLFFSNNIIYAERENQCLNFSSFSLTRVLSDFLGFTNYHNGEWWFIRAYIFGMILLCIYVKCTRKINCLLKEIGLIAAIQLINELLFSDIIFNNFSRLNNDLFYKLWNNMQWSVVLPGIIIWGYVMAKYDVLSKIYSGIKSMNWFKQLIYVLLSILILVESRYIFGGKGMDYILVPVLIITCKIVFDKISILAKVMGFFGKHSTNMWLIHTFYCYYFYKVVKIVYSTKNAYIDWMIFLVLTLVSSILVNVFWKLIMKIPECVSKKNKDVINS